ncbi:MAG TPA: hypothetical protein VFA07_03900 [Chthonomonadaceae bacterium]|nr:hypothetical protein [Chthonomonadaceae bacterium]
MFKRLFSACFAAVALFLMLGGCEVEFSPDGKQIVFLWDTQAHKKGLYIINADGTGFHPLPGGADGLQARWSPDGRYLIFNAQQNSQMQPAAQQQDVVRLYDTQSRQTKLIASGVDAPFAWRADSRQCASIGGTTGKLEIRIYHVPDGSLISHVPLPPTIQGIELFNEQMLWLPNSDSIVFFGYNAQGHDLYSVEGSQVRSITSSHDVIGCGLSADGRRLIWARSGTSGGSVWIALWSMDLTTRSASRLPFPRHLPFSKARRADADIRYVAFSPDGQRMALAAFLPIGHRRNGNTKQYPAVFTVRLDGTGLRQAQRSDREEDMLIPSWSHDGKRLAVLRMGKKFGPVSIHLYNADGTGRVRIPLPPLPKDR